MESSIFSGIGIDPGIIVIVLAILTLISFIASVICFSQYRKLYRRYDMFMRGKDAETLEDTIMELVDETEYLRAKDGDTKRPGGFGCLQGAGLDTEKTGMSSTMRLRAWAAI